MDNKNLYYGKNVNTGAIEQLKSVGNVLLVNSGTLNDLSDVVISSASTGQSLFYNGTNWVNRKPDINDISGIVITTPTTDQLLKYNGTNWINGSEPTKEYFSLTVFGTCAAVLYDNTTAYKKILILNGVYWSGTIPNPAGGVNGFINKTANFTYNTSTGYITGFNTSKRYRIDAVANLNNMNLSTAVTWYFAITNWTSGSQAFLAFTAGTQSIDYAGIGLNTTAFVTGVTTVTIETAVSNLIAVDGASVDTTISFVIQEI